MKRFFFLAIFLITVGLPLMAADGEPSGGFNVWQIISAVLAIATTLLATVMSKVRGKLRQVLKLGKETLEYGQAGWNLADAVITAGDDNVYDKVEQEDIKNKAQLAKQEWQDVKAAWKLLWAKAG